MRFLLVLLFAAGTLGTGDGKTVEVDLLEVIGWPSGGPFGGRGVGSYARAVPVHLRRVTQDGGPVARQRAELRWKGGQRVLMTDREGRLRTVLHGDRLEAPRLVVPSGTKVIVDPEKQVRVLTRSSVSRTGVRSRSEVRRVDAESLARIESGGVTVAYRPGSAAVADAAPSVLGELERIRGFVYGACGLRLADDGSFGVFLVDDSPVDSRASRFDVEVRGAAWIPLRLSDWKGDGGEGALAPWIWVHEWVEWTLASKGLYAVDPALRTFGDGMAEWIALEYCRAFRPGVARQRIREGGERVRALRRSGASRYDLPESFRAAARSGKGRVIGPRNDSEGAAAASNELETILGGDPTLIAAGYPVALWFWCRSLDTNPGAARITIDSMTSLLEEDGAATLPALLDRLDRSGIATPDLRPSLDRVQADLAEISERLR